MKRKIELLVAVIAAEFLAAAAGCSRSQTEVESPKTADSTAVSGYTKLYDQNSLKEVRDFKDLPPEVRKHLDPLGHSFMIAGLSDTSALVGYQVGDFVPTYTADAFVFAGSKWIKIKSWDAIAEAKKLSELIETVQYTEQYSTSEKGLAATLSHLNLADPISDLNKNIALEKTYFVGICEPPGHSPGVAEADEPLVHTAAHGLWCLPGSGDLVTSSDYSKLINQARAYAAKYNAELVRRIRRAR
jgi:hypothetical protein